MSRTWLNSFDIHTRYRRTTTTPRDDQASQLGRPRAAARNGTPRVVGGQLDAQNPKRVGSRRDWRNDSRFSSFIHRKITVWFLSDEHDHRKGRVLFLNPFRTPVPFFWGQGGHIPSNLSPIVLKTRLQS